LGEQATHLDLSPEARTDLQALQRDGLHQAATTAQALFAQQARLAEEAEHRRLEFASIPNLDTVKPLVHERDRLRAEIAELEAEDAGLQADIERLARDIERKQQRLARLLEVDARSRLQRDDRERILHHSAKVRGTLAVFRRAVIERHLRRIEQLVFESYRQLLRKTSLVSRLTIDPVSFAITLYGQDGQELPSDRLSAGERQLLAVALLWGLAKASGRPLPTAIDTPLGRLDATHRAHLVERYFPYASHQVLLLSTDEEITGEYLARLQPWIGRTYHLEYDDASGSTRIAPGYFERREAA
jgi:DNA sulfur modification protein DndD